MSTTYAQHQTTAQKKDASTAASVLDASSQSESLQRKADMANGVVQRLFENTMPGSFDNENQAAIHAATSRNFTSPEDIQIGADKDTIGPGPFATFGPRFKPFIASRSEKQFKWILSPKIGLVVIDDDLKHSIAAGGAPVITAGHGRCTNTDPLSVNINNDTGHYLTDFNSLQESKRAWEDVGIDVSFTEFKHQDFKALFDKFGKK